MLISGEIILEKLIKGGPKSASELAAATDSGLEEVERKLEELMERRLLKVIREEPTKYYWLSKEGKKLLSSK